MYWLADRLTKCTPKVYAERDRLTSNTHYIRLKELLHPEGTSKNLDKPKNSENGANICVYENFFLDFQSSEFFGSCRFCRDGLMLLQGVLTC